jgi:hypothetical protein
MKKIQEEEKDLDAAPPMDFKELKTLEGLITPVKTFYDLMIEYDEFVKSWN